MTTDNVRRAHSLLAAVGVLAVALAVGLTMPSGRAAPEPGPVFTPWDGLEKGEHYDVALRADGEMCALCDGHGRLQVCRFGEQGRIGDAIWASSGTGAAVDECDWAGEHLVYRSVEGVDDLRAWVNDPPDDILGYMRRHARICIAEPEKQTWETVASGFMATGLLGGTDPPRFAVFRYDPPYGLLVEIHDGPSFELKRSYRIEEKDRFGRLSPLGWFRGGSIMLVLARAEGQTEQRGRDIWPALVTFDADGREHHLTNSTDNRLWSEGHYDWSRGDEVLDWGILMPAPVNDWALVATTLAPAGDRRTRLGFFDANGLVSVLPLDAKWQLGPKELRTQGHYMMNTIAITPDGRKLVLQGLTFDRPAEGDYVWLWDYRTREAELIGRAPPVQRLFGWLRDRFLVVETGIDTAPSYGVIDTAQRAKAGVEP